MNEGRSASRRLGEQETPRAAEVGPDFQRHATGDRRRRLVFALAELEYPTPALRRVAAMATTLDGDLFILRVLAPALPTRSRVPSQRVAPSDVERVDLARRGTAAWWERTLLQPCADESIRVVLGDFAREVSAYARALGALCVILAPTQSGSAGTMTALLGECRQPVFSTPYAGQQWVAALLAAARVADGR
jgi:hypothetical protein